MNVGSKLDWSLTEARHGEQVTGLIEQNNFDYIRLFAATQVVIFHGLYHLGLDVPAWTNLFAPFSGVPIFFVVSGFLITGSYERSTSLRSYAEKRARRIIPGLWFCLLITGAVLLVLGYPLVSASGIGWFLSQFAALVYTPAFLRSFGFGSYNGSLWTIPVELQFYATVPILSLIVRRAANRTVLLVTLLVLTTLLDLAIRIQVPSVTGMFESPQTLPEKLIKYSFATHYFLFLLGAAAYYLSLHLRPWLRGKALVWLAALIAVDLLVPYSIVSIVASQVILGLLTISAAFTAVGRNRLAGYDISYGVYLFHGLILNLMITLSLFGSPLSLYLLLACSYVAGAISWILVESRFLKRARKMPLGSREAS